MYPNSALSAGSGGRITAITNSLDFISPAIDRATSRACSACGDASNATNILWNPTKTVLPMVMTYTSSAAGVCCAACSDSLVAGG